jgi:hypothetical protein
MVKSWLGQAVGRMDKYILDELKVLVVVTITTTVNLSSFHLSSSSSSFYLWYSHLGHVSFSRLRFLASTWALENLQTCDISDCSGCKLAKFSALLFNRSIFCFSFPFDLIHFDVWGSSLIATKKVLDIMFHLLMIILVIVGFI